jgi:hypothetical protein
MDKLLPQIEMPKPPEPEVVENLLPDSGDPSDKQLIEKIQKDLLDDIPQDDDPLIQVTQRNIPEEDEVFGDPPTVEPLQDDNSQINSEYPPVEEERKGKRKYTRKAPMSDKQKLHLEKIRAIAAEKRKEKKAEKELLKKQKEEEKEESRLKKAEQRILAKQRKEQEEINNNVLSNQEPPTPRNTPQMGFSREDMEKAMFSAISSYETIRKAEKEEKKKRQLAEARENQMKRTLQQAIHPEKPVDPWRQFFA